MALSSSASTVIRPVTISHDANDGAFTTASSCSARFRRPQPPARRILAWQLRAARVVDRPVRRSAARIAAR